jgi:hypothetical protein
MTEKAGAAYLVELTAARAEAQSLLAANEITNKTCEALRRELADRPPSGRVRELEIELANVRMSHSWRVTAPLRHISRMLYRRP